MNFNQQGPGMNALLPTRLRVAANGMKGIHADVVREAAAEIERLRDLVRTLIDNDPMEPISDAGHVVLDLWRHDARKALGMDQ